MTELVTPSPRYRASFVAARAESNELVTPSARYRASFVAARAESNVG